MPNLGTVMLWQTLVQSFRNLTAPKQHPILKAALPAGVDAEEIEASFKKLPKKPVAQKPEKKTEVKAAA